MRIWSGFLGGWVVVMALGVATTPARAVTITDGDFTNWTSSYTTSGGSSHAGTVVPTGGNPGARFLSYITNGSPVTHSANVKNDYVNTAALTGASFTLSADYLQGPSGTPVQSFGLIVQQGSNIWRYGLTVVVGTAAWQNVSGNGTFNPANFALSVGSGSPDFSAGVQTKFGLYTHIQQGGGDYTMYYDNWSLTSTALDAPIIPEPASLALLAAGAVLILRRRRPASA